MINILFSLGYFLICDGQMRSCVERWKVRSKTKISAVRRAVDS